MPFIYRVMLLLVLGFLAGFGITDVDAQTRAGSSPSNASSSETVNNACRERVNDLRIGIGSLRDDINKIRECSENGQLAVRDAGVITCRDVTQGHHVWDVTTTDIRFATDPNTFGDNKSLVGPAGDPGRNVRCEPCAETWVDPVCPANHNGNYTAWQTCSTGVAADCELCYGPAQEITQSCSCVLPGVWQGPSCPAGFTGTHTALQTCSIFGQCCGSAPTASVECCNGSVCAPCDDWTAVNTMCPALGHNIISGYECPSGNCCGAAPAPETCPDSCSPGFYTYNYTNWTTCDAGQQTRECQRCDGQSADCGECGGECSRTCTPQCTTYSWHQSSNWGACSGGGNYTCGAGQQTRPGVCRCDQSGEIVSNTLCATTDYQRACTYSYAFDTEWGACSGGTRIKACERCDGQSASCAQCGGACPSESCGNPNVTYYWSRVSRVYGPGMGCHLYDDMSRALGDVTQGVLIAHGPCPYSGCDFTVNESNHPCNAESAGYAIHVLQSCGAWQSGMEGYSGYLCEASDGSHCPDNGGYGDSTWDDDGC